MELLSAAEVINLPLNTKEDTNRSRSLQGHHVFLSRYLFYIKNKNPQEQRELYHQVFGSNAGESDCSSIDSNDTAYYELIHNELKYKYIRRLIYHKWRELSEEKKEAWKTRATNLNARLLPGEVLTIPGEKLLLLCILY